MAGAVGQFAATSFSTAQATQAFFFKAGMHGLLGGMQSLSGGGSFKSGFASGAVSSMVGGAIMKGTKGNPIATILFGGLSGGVSAEMAGGNFWAGARQGLITAGLNHAANHMADKVTHEYKSVKEFTHKVGVLQADGTIVNGDNNCVPLSLKSLEDLHGYPVNIYKMRLEQGRISGQNLDIERALTSIGVDLSSDVMYPILDPSVLAAFIDAGIPTFINDVSSRTINGTVLNESHLVALQKVVQFYNSSGGLKRSEIYVMDPDVGKNTLFKAQGNTKVYSIFNVMSKRP